jgi:hypothetical protein
MWGSLGSFDTLTSPVEGKPPPALMHGRGKPERGTFFWDFFRSSKHQIEIGYRTVPATDEKYI